MIQFNDAKIAIKYLLRREGTNELKFPTIGGNAQLRMRLEEPQIVFYNTRDTKFLVDQEKWNAVYQRRISLPDNQKNQNFRYGQSWDSMPKCLNYIIAPYIPAIIIYLENENYPVPLERLKDLEDEYLGPFI